MSAYGQKRPSVKDLGARCKTISLLLALAATFGCQGLSATQPTVSQSGSLSIAAPNLNFGTVLVGHSEVLTNTILNTSDSRITVLRAAVDKSDFSIAGDKLPVTLAPGDSAPFSVAYNPRAHGKSTGTVTLDTTTATSTTIASASTTFTASGNAANPGQLTVTPSSITFGSVPVGTTQTQSATLANPGGSSLTISQATVNGNGFTLSGLTMPLTLAAGQSVVVSVSFTPPAGGPDSGSISLAFVVSTQGHNGKGHGGGFAGTNNSSTVMVPVSGTGMTGGQLAATPASLSLGNVQVGTSQTQQVTITNSGGTSATISQATTTGTGFSTSGLALPLTLAAGQSQSFNVTFAPQVAGSVSGSISLSSDATNPTLSILLSATAVTPGSLVSNPSSLSFGNVQTGTTQTLSATLTNSGGTSVTISQASASGSGYTLSGLSLPTTLSAGQSKTFSVQFAPQTSGSVSGNVAITSDASNPTLSVPLSGSGVTPGTLGASPSSLSFGTVLVGNNSSLQETLTNTGGSSVTISQANVSGSGFSVSGVPATLAAGQSANFNVTFAPQSGGAVSGSVSIVSNASNSTLKITLSGTGATPGVLSASSQTLSFGNVQVSGSTTQSETLTNTGGTTVTVSQANVSGGSGFSITGLNLPLTLIAGQSFTFGATFAPASAGSVTGTISLTSDASNSTLTISLSGTGTVPGQLSVSPSTLDFSSVVIGQSKNMTATLSATGSNVTVSSASASTSEFTLSGVSFPFTITAGQSKPVTVTFTPQSSGTASATISFASNASNSPTSESLTGNGTAPPPHNVDLSWAASSSTDVVGYNVYRATVSGGPFTKINTALNATTAFVDNSVLAGQTYYYVTTAVDGTGLESGYSNQVKTIIPTP
jgi:HYDIN/CFA65/VesB family protein/centrosomal CEP192-like protein/ASPM-SPD-2-Hydin domain-containing protein